MWSCKRVLFPYCEQGKVGIWHFWPIVVFIGFILMKNHLFVAGFAADTKKIKNVYGLMQLEQLRSTSPEILSKIEIHFVKPISRF